VEHDAHRASAGVSGLRDAPRRLIAGRYLKFQSCPVSTTGAPL
jgi:hypothetical protein